MAYHSTTRRFEVENKVLAWLSHRPCTSRELADLLGISPNHASATLCRLYRRQKVTRTGARSYGYLYRLSEDV